MTPAQAEEKRRERHFALYVALLTSAHAMREVEIRDGMPIEERDDDRSLASSCFGKANDYLEAYEDIDGAGSR